MDPTFNLDPGSPHPQDLVNFRYSHHHLDLIQSSLTCSRIHHLESLFSSSFLLAININMMIRRPRGLGARKPPQDGARTHEVSREITTHPTMSTDQTIMMPLLKGAPTLLGPSVTPTMEDLCLFPDRLLMTTIYQNLKGAPTLRPSASKKPTDARSFPPWHEVDI